MNKNPNRHSVSRVVLPSGRAIAVVRFHNEPKRPGADLHVCPECASDLVQPVAWIEAAGDGWELTLSCPNCRWGYVGVCTDEQVENFEEKLDDGVETMLRDLQRLTHANMADQVDRFVSALRADVILPEDF
jgi:hypothetical protein